MIGPDDRIKKKFLKIWFHDILQAKNEMLKKSLLISIKFCLGKYKSEDSQYKVAPIAHTLETSFLF